jgi:hypothetical protein
MGGGAGLPDLPLDGRGRATLPAGGFDEDGMVQI